MVYLFQLAAPVVFQIFVLPRVKNAIEQSGVKPVHLSISRIGLYSASLKNVSTGFSQQPYQNFRFCASEITIGYSLFQLLNGTVSLVSIPCLDIYASGNTPADTCPTPFFSCSKKAQLQKKEQTGSGSEPSKAQKEKSVSCAEPEKKKAWQIKRLEIARFRFHGENIPVLDEKSLILHGNMVGSNIGMYRKIYLGLNLFHQKGVSSFHLVTDMQEEKTASLFWRVSGVPILEIFENVADRAKIKGDIEIQTHGKTDLGFSPFAIHHTRAEVFAKKGSLQIAGYELPSPFSISIAKQTGNASWAAEISGISIQAPIGLSLDPLTFQLSLFPENSSRFISGKAKGNIHIQTDRYKTNDTGGILIKKAVDVPFHGNFQAGPEKWEASLFSGLEKEKSAVFSGQIQKACEWEAFLQDFSFFVKSGKDPEIKGSADFSGIRIEKDNTVLSCAKLNLDAVLPNWVFSVLHAKLDISQLDIQSESQNRINIGAMETQLKWDDLKNNILRFSGETNIKEIDGMIQKIPFHLKHLKAGIPYPESGPSHLPDKKESHNHLQITSLDVNGILMQEIHGIIQRRNQNSIKALFEIEQAEENKFSEQNAKGFVQYNDTGCFDAEIQYHPLSSAREKSLSELLFKKDKKLSGWQVKGDTDLLCRIVKCPFNSDLRFSLEISNGAIDNPDMNVAVSGIAFTGEVRIFPEAHTIRPFQISFEKASAGKLEILEAEAEGQVLPGFAFSADNGAFSFLEGSLEISRLHFDPRKEELDIHVHGKEISISRIFEVFELGNAKGKSTMNVYLPVQYKEGRFRFEKGYMYSTPGEGGDVEIKGVEKLMEYLPQKGLEYFQMELAKEALQDFSYNWFAIRFHSEEENLLVNISVDGKPNQPLPFEYKRDVGAFVRVEGESPGSEFQGIRLDLNLNIPLDRILAHKQLLMMFQSSN